MFSLAASGGMGGGLSIILLYAVIIGGFYWILMRPQKKEQKRVAAMISEFDISDDDVIVEFGSNRNCRIPMQKAAIAQVEKPAAD